MKTPVLELKPKGDPKTYAIEFRYGPDKRGPKLCLYCNKPFVRGDSWRLSWDPENNYAVGVHTKCVIGSTGRRVKKN